MKKQKLLFTGGFGFLGKNIIPILSKYYEIDTLGLVEQNTYSIDLATNIPTLNCSYDIVIHAAGIAHFTPKTEKENQIFYDVNFQGTKNLCSALELTRIPKSFIFISTAAVYGLDNGENITEEYPLNGFSPYAKSKILSERFLLDWCKNNNVILSIIRPSLIAGKNPLGNLGAIINGIKKGYYFRIGDGKSKKSVLMADDIAYLIPKLIETGGIYNICDDYHPSFLEMESLIAKQLGNKSVFSCPYFVAKFLTIIANIIGLKTPLNSLVLKKIANTLTLSNEKAKKELNWTPKDVLSNFTLQ